MDVARSSSCRTSDSDSAAFLKTYSTSMSKSRPSVAVRIQRARFEANAAQTRTIALATTDAMTFAMKFITMHSARREEPSH